MGPLRFPLGIHASGISILLSLLMLLGWSLMWISGIEIPEAWVPTIKKHNNRRMVQQWTTEGTATHWNNGTIGGSKCTNHSRPLWYKCYRAISQPYRLKKTSSKRSKRHDLHLKWHRETNDNTLHYIRGIKITCGKYKEVSEFNYRHYRVISKSDLK